MNRLVVVCPSGKHKVKSARAGTSSMTKLYKWHLMAPFPNRSEMPSFYWDSVNKTRIANFNLMLGFIPNSWKMKTEPTAALQSKTAGERRAARLPAAQHHAPNLPGQESSAAPSDTLQATADVVGRAHGGLRNPTTKRILGLYHLFHRHFSCKWFFKCNRTNQILGRMWRHLVSDVLCREVYWRPWVGTVAIKRLFYLNSWCISLKHLFIIVTWINIVIINPVVLPLTPIYSHPAWKSIKVKFM